MPSFNGDRRSLPDGHEELIDLDDDAEPAPLCAICQSEKECLNVERHPQEHHQ
jgi:hypothetical protein